MLEHHPKTLNSFLHTFPWIHIGVGVVGHLAFVLGSVMFLFGMSAGVFFVIGSIGMLIGSTGYMFVQIESRRLRNLGHDPATMPTLRRSEAVAQQAAESAEAAEQAAEDAASDAAESDRASS